MSGAEPGHRAGKGDLALAAAFTLAVLVSSALLFAVQPMFARLVLPLLGGSPTVWTVSLFFFQTALLVGYGWAHALGLWLKPVSAGLVHITLMVLAAAAFPIAIPSGWSDPPPGEPVLWQLSLFAAAIGLPFVVLAANAPLLQAWFARSGHRRAGNPYFLYAASNVGSLAALLGYPLLLEPALGVSALASGWSVGFLLLIGAITACLLLLRPRLQGVDTDVTGARASAAVQTVPPMAAGAGERLRWAWLAAVPAALLTAFTAHIATDIASAPLIWVVPLAAYLATFVAVFREPPLVSRRVLTVAHALAVMIALLQLGQVRYDGVFVSAACGGLAFLASTLSAHRTLYDTRPPAHRLTEFYLWMSAGGALGGMFSALLAPQLFSEVFEYPLLLALGVTCLPGVLGIGKSPLLEIARALLLATIGATVLALAPNALLAAGLPTGSLGLTFLMTALFAGAMLACWWEPKLVAVAAGLMALTVIVLPSDINRGDAVRSFFGVYRVRESETREFNYLSHGTTLHGAQRVREADGTAVISDTTPLTYYHPRSPMAHSVELQRQAARAAGRAMRVGIVGLGTGALGCYAEPGEAWRFFEIDPVVIHIASDPANFSFLDSCQREPDIVIGDARLSIAREADGSFDLIIVDAFSSDAVPVHLLTAEAMALYAAKLSSIGVAVLHISNRYLDLETAVSATVPTVPGLGGTLVVDNEHASEDGFSESLSSVAVISPSPAALKPYRDLAEAVLLDGHHTRPWTDDHADVLGALLRRIEWMWPWSRREPPQ